VERPGFGNARAVRNMLEAAISRQSTRVLEGKRAGEQNDEAWFDSRQGRATGLAAATDRSIEQLKAYGCTCPLQLILLPICLKITSDMQGYSWSATSAVHLLNCLLT